MRRTVTECNERTAPQCDAMPSPFLLRERPPPTWRVLPETATPTPEQGTRTQDEEDGSLPRHSLAGTHAATPGPDPPYPLHRPLNGNGSAGGRARQGTLRRQCFALSDQGSSCDPPLLPLMLFSVGATRRKGQDPGACCGPARQNTVAVVAAAAAAVTATVAVAVASAVAGGQRPPPLLPRLFLLRVLPPPLP